METGLSADHKLEQVAKRAGVRESTLRKTLEKSRNTLDRVGRNPSGVPDQKAAQSLADRLQLQNSRLQKIEKNLAATIAALHSLDEPGVDVDSLKERILEINEKRGKSELPDVEKSTVFSKEVSYNEESLDENKKREIEELILHFEIAVLQSLNQDLQVKLKSVDEKGQRKNLLAEYQDNSSRLETLKDQLRELG
jgi:tRNA U34 5-carboxymethylaminomethyl modifying enzyme MnmG/GidA